MRPRNGFVSVSEELIRKLVKYVAVKLQIEELWKEPLTGIDVPLKTKVPLKPPTTPLLPPVTQSEEKPAPSTPLLVLHTAKLAPESETFVVAVLASVSVPPLEMPNHQSFAPMYDPETFRRLPLKVKVPENAAVMPVEPGQVMAVVPVARPLGVGAVAAPEHTTACALVREMLLFKARVAM